MESSLPCAAHNNRKLPNKFEILDKYVRILRTEFKTKYPFRVYRREHLFWNPQTDQMTCNYRAESWGWRRLYGCCDGPPNYKKRFVIYVAYHADASFMADTLFHEFAHVLEWPPKRKEHTQKYFAAYGRIYQRCIDNFKE